MGHGDDLSLVEENVLMEGYLDKKGPSSFMAHKKYTYLTDLLVLTRPITHLAVIIIRDTMTEIPSPIFHTLTRKNFTENNIEMRIC